MSCARGAPRWPSASGCRHPPPLAPTCAATHRAIAARSTRWRPRCSPGRGAGAGPGSSPLTIDMDSSITEVYGPARQGAVFGHTKVRGYHWLMASTAGAGDVGGRARQRRQCPHRSGGEEPLDRGVQPSPGSRGIGAAHHAGRLGLLLGERGRCLREGRGRLLHRDQDVRRACTPPSTPSPSPTGRPSRTSWTTAPTWPRPPTGPSAGKSQSASSCAGSGPPHARSWRFTSYSYHAFITDRVGETVAVEADHRRHAEVELVIRDLNRSHSHCALISPSLREQSILLRSCLYTQATAPPPPDVHGGQLTAVDPVQHGLAGHPERLGGLVER